MTTIKITVTLPSFDSNAPPQVSYNTNIVPVDNAPLCSAAVSPIPVQYSINEDSKQKAYDCVDGVTEVMNKPYLQQIRNLSRYFNGFDIFCAFLSEMEKHFDHMDDLKTEVLKGDCSVIATIDFLKYSELVDKSIDSMYENILKTLHDSMAPNKYQ